MDTYPKSRAHYSLVHQVRGWYSGVELKMSRRQAAGAYLNRYVTDEQRSRRLIFSSTPWAVQSWRFLGVARSTRISLDTGLRSRLPKSPTLRRRRYTSLGLGALIWIGAICFSTAVFAQNRYQITRVPTAEGANSVALGINRKGDVVGYSFQGEDYRAYLYSSADQSVANVGSFGGKIN